MVFGKKLNINEVIQRFPRLRESEIFVFGVGEKKTPISFRNACDDFIYTENVDNEPSSELSGLGEPSKNPSPKELIPVLKKAWNQYQDEEGWANVAPVGNYVKRAMPDFDPRSFGATKLPEIISKLPEFEMTKFKGKNNVYIVAYKPK